MTIKSKRPYKWISAIILACGFLILITGNVLLWKKILLFGAILTITLFVISDLVIDEGGILYNHPFIPFLNKKKISWTEIERIEVTIKSVIIDGIKNPSTLMFFYKNGQKFKISYEPSVKDVEVLKSLAIKNNIPVKVIGLAS